MKFGLKTTHPKDIGVVYIIFREFGIEHFNSFMKSYSSIDAGVEHDMLFVFKGFSSVQDIELYQKSIDYTDQSYLIAPNQGYDIGTYKYVSQKWDRKYYCFLNSKSVIIGHNWLQKLCSHACLQNVGMVGATGSFESLLTDYLQMREASGRRWWPWRLVVRNSWLNELRHRFYFPPFPNPHLRTNAFMIRREALLKIKHRPIIKRLDAARFENGRNNISQQIKKMGLDVLVVGRDGKAYYPDQWAASGTFWQGDQSNLLVADNQTEKYELSSDSEKKILTLKAWGG